MKTNYKKTALPAVLAALAMTLAGIWGCGQKERGDTEAVNGSAPGGDAEVGYTLLAGGTLSFADGGVAPIVGIATFDEYPARFAGLLALEGKVAERFEDRYTFMLVDTARMDNCGATCCSQASVPIRLIRDEYEGVLPAVNENVIVVGKLVVTATGYDFEVVEVRRGDDRLIRRAGA